MHALGNHIYLNLANNKWGASDKFQSGNVIIKLSIAKEVAEKTPDNAQLQRSVEAVEEIQPQKIPLNYWI